MDRGDGWGFLHISLDVTFLLGGLLGPCRLYVTASTAPKVRYVVKSVLAQEVGGQAHPPRLL
ncbi:hypothetical protein E2C01_079090 [Portunus trituberculatus]|uniref:Uncharacterized protein n=1 Tax=Portunus trituberculatus TaxID=210409 RepID=A0A5B7IPP9_PORTR|nr:hypothetical protein [Portunus trituberculatus]